MERGLSFIIQILKVERCEDVDSLNFNFQLVLRGKFPFKYLEQFLEIRSP
jgi:hypothetical protein